MRCWAKNLLPGRPQALAYQHWPGRAGITVEMTPRASKGENCMMYRHSRAPARELFRVRLQSQRRLSCLSVTGLLRWCSCSLYERGRRDLNDGRKEKLDQTSTNLVQINPDSRVPSFEGPEIGQTDSFPLNRRRKIGGRRWSLYFGQEFTSSILDWRETKLPKIRVCAVQRSWSYSCQFRISTAIWISQRLLLTYRDTRERKSDSALQSFPLHPFHIQGLFFFSLVNSYY